MQFSKQISNGARNIFTILLVFGLAGGIGLFFLKVDRTHSNVLTQAQETPKKSDSLVESSNISATLKIEGTSDVSYAISLPKGSSAYNLMEVAKAQGLDFKARQFAGLGVFIDEINGIKSSQKDGKYWVYYINGQAALVGISSYIIKPNDVISWKYEKQE